MGGGTYVDGVLWVPPSRANSPQDMSDVSRLADQDICLLSIHDEVLGSIDEGAIARGYCMHYYCCTTSSERKDYCTCT